MDLKCPACGERALDGKVTCGRAECGPSTGAWQARIASPSSNSNSPRTPEPQTPNPEPSVDPLVAALVRIATGHITTMEEACEAARDALLEFGFDDAADLARED